jgi:hypothetical protein
VQWKSLLRVSVEEVLWGKPHGTFLTVQLEPPPFRANYCLIVRRNSQNIPNSVTNGEPNNFVAEKEVELVNS